MRIEPSRWSSSEFRRGLAPGEATPRGRIHPGTRGNKGSAARVPGMTQTEGSHLLARCSSAAATPPFLKKKEKGGGKGLRPFIDRGAEKPLGKIAWCVILQSFRNGRRMIQALKRDEQHRAGPAA